MRYDISEATCAHDDAAGMYGLSDVTIRSRGEYRRSGHASGVDGIHWRVLLDLLVAIGFFLCRIISYLKGCKVSRLCLDEFVFIVLYLAL